MKQEIKTNPLMYVNRYIKFLQNRGNLSAVDVLGERERRKMTIRVYTPHHLIVFTLQDEWNGLQFEIHALRSMRQKIAEILSSSDCITYRSLMCEEIVFPFSRAGIKRFDRPFLYPHPKYNSQI